MKNLLLAFIVFMAVSPHDTFAQGSDHVNVYFMKDRNSQTNYRLVYNPLTTYGDTITVQVTPGRNTVQYQPVDDGGNDAGDPITVNLTPIAVRVAAAWNNLLARPLHPFTITTTGGGVINLIVQNLDLDNANFVVGGMLGGAAGWTRPPYARGSVFEVAPDVIGANPPPVGAGMIAVLTNLRIPEESIDDFKEYFGVDTAQEALDRYAYFILMHEFGHALGLAHPEYLEAQTYQGDRGLASAPFQQMPLDYTDLNPLMTRDNGLLYVERLFRTLHRAVQESDIIPATGELDTLLNILHGGCFPSPDAKAATLDTDGCYPGITLGKAYFPNGVPTPYVPTTPVVIDPPSGNSGNSWRRTIACFVTGYVFYDHLSCDTADGVTYKASLWGIAGTVGEFTGTIYFDDTWPHYDGKSCHTIMTATGVVVVHITCDGYHAKIVGAGFDFGEVSGSGHFN